MRGRSLTAEHQSEGILVYEHNVWDGFLIRRLLPCARRVWASPDDDIEFFRPLVRSDCRAMVFQFAISTQQKYPIKRAEVIKWLRQRGVPTVNARCADATKRSLYRACDRIRIPSLLTDLSFGKR